MGSAVSSREAEAVSRQVEAVRAMAITEPETFLCFCRMAGVVSLAELPWFTGLTYSHPAAFRRLCLMAKEAGIGTK